MASLPVGSSSNILRGPWYTEAKQDAGSRPHWNVLVTVSREKTCQRSHCQNHHAKVNYINCFQMDSHAVSSGHMPSCPQKQNIHSIQGKHMELLNRNQVGFSITDNSIPFTPTKTRHVCLSTVVLNKCYLQPTGYTKKCHKKRSCSCKGYFRK